MAASSVSSLASELIATSESGADRPSRPVLTDGRATSRVSSTARGRGASSRAGSPALRLRTLATLRNALGSDPLRLLCCSGTSSLAHTPRTAPCALRCDPAAPQGCPSRCPIRPVDRPGRATVPRISPIRRTAGAGVSTDNAAARLLQGRLDTSRAGERDGADGSPPMPTLPPKAESSKLLCSADSVRHRSSSLPQSAITASEALPTCEWSAPQRLKASAASM